MWHVAGNNCRYRVHFAQTNKCIFHLHGRNIRKMHKPPPPPSPTPPHPLGVWELATAAFGQLELQVANLWASWHKQRKRQQQRPRQVQHPPSNLHLVNKTFFSFAIQICVVWHCYYYLLLLFLFVADCCSGWVGAIDIVNTKTVCTLRSIFCFFSRRFQYLPAPNKANLQLQLQLQLNSKKKLTRHKNV